MSEKIETVRSYEAGDYEETTVFYEGDNRSAVIVNNPGDTVDFYGDLGYGSDPLHSPEVNPTGRIFIAGTQEDGGKCCIVIDNRYTVCFGVDGNGKRYSEVLNTASLAYMKACTKGQ